MVACEEVVLEISGEGGVITRLKAFSVQKWPDIVADLERLFPHLGEGAVRKGFQYKNTFGREIVVNDEGSLQKFFRDAVEENELTQTVVLVATRASTASLPKAELIKPDSAPATPKSAASTATAKSATSNAVQVAAVEFPPSSTGDAAMQVRPVVEWADDSITVSFFVCCTSDEPNSFLFSYSKRLYGSIVLELALSSPSALKVHLKGDVTETSASITLGKWQHVVLTWSSRDGSLVLYIDGSKAFTASKLRVGAALEQGGAFRLGNSAEGRNHAFVGSMAEVSIWQTVLAREVIRKMSQSPVLKGSEDGLCLYFNFKLKRDDNSSLLIDVTSEYQAQLRGGAALAPRTVTIRGLADSSAQAQSGAGAGDGEGAASSAARFTSAAIRFEERAFGRLVTAPPGHLVANELTLALWLCCSETLQRGTIVSWVWPHAPGLLHRIQLADCSNLEVTIGPEASALRSKVAVNDGRWHCVALTWKAEDGALKLFVDGTERFAAHGVATGLRLDERAATEGSKAREGTGTLMLGQCLRDLSKRGVRDLEDAYFGLVAHFSVWRAALGVGAVRKLSGGPLEGAEKDLVLYLNPASLEFRARIVNDAAQAKQGNKLEWAALGPVDLLNAEVIAPGGPCAAALPVVDRQIKSRTVAIEAKKAGRLAVHPVPLPAASPASPQQMSLCGWFMVSPDHKGGAAAGHTLFSYNSGPPQEWEEEREGEGAEGAAVDPGFLVLSNSSNLTVRVQEQSVKTGCRLQAGVWYHVSLTWQAEDGACCLYLNCERQWAGKVGQGVSFEGKQASLWVGQEHSWDMVSTAQEAGVPLALLCSLVHSANKKEAAGVLGTEEAAQHVAKLKELAGKALPAYKGGDEALAGAIYEWLCSASCIEAGGFVGQVAAPCVWSRVLSRNDLVFVSNGALLGNEKGLLACLDLARYVEEEALVPDCFFDELNGAVVGGCHVGNHEVELRAGVVWAPPIAPGTVPKEEGELCALYLGRGGPEKASCEFRLCDLAPGSEQAVHGISDLSISFWIRTCDAGNDSVVLSFSTANEPHAILVARPGGLEVHIAGNKLATGVAVNDGLWHHVAIVWTGKAMKDKDGKKHKGQLLVYVNHVLLHRGEGQTNGAEHLANAAGSFALGSGAGSRSSFEGYLASLALFDKCLDAKAVGSFFMAPLLRGSEKGLRLYLDFDFEMDEGRSPREILNRVKRNAGGTSSGGVLKGAAQLVLLRGPYRLQKVSNLVCIDTPGVAKARGAIQCKCLEFKDKRAEACVYLNPADIVPERMLSLIMWVRTSDAGGQGTIVSYAAYKRKAFNLRVAHKGSDGTEKSQLVRVDGGMLFAQLVEKLHKTFGELLTVRHSLQGDGTVSSQKDFEAFCDLAEKKMDEEDLVTPPTPTAMPTTPSGAPGRSQRHKAIAVTTAPFKSGAKVLTAPVDPAKLAQMVEVEEICIANPADVQVAIRGHHCKGDIPIRINDGRWHHLALTWQSKGGQLTFFVDGNVRLEKTGVHQNGRILPSGCLAFGQSQSSVAKDFKKGAGFAGQIAHVALWKKILPLPRVLRCISAPLKGNEEGLLLLWEFAVDPFLGFQIPNAATAKATASSSSSSTAVTGQLRDKAALGWGDATLPGDGRISGLGLSSDIADSISIEVKCSMLSDALLADSSVKGLFFHVVVGEEGNDMEHALRHGCFPFAKTSWQEAKHVQVLHLDEIGHGMQRRTLQRLACNRTTKDAEMLLHVQLCREVVAKAGDVLSEVLAAGTLDLFEYLDAGRDESGKELRLWPPGQKGAEMGLKSEPSAAVIVDVKAVAALRALIATNKTQSSSVAVDNSKFSEDIPKFERSPSNFSRSSSRVEAGAATPTAPDTPNVSAGVTRQPSTQAIAEASAPTQVPLPSPAPAPAPPRPTSTAKHSSAAPAEKAKKKPDDDDGMDLPERIVLACKASGRPSFKVVMGFNLKWSEAQKNLEKELGKGHCIEFIDPKTKKACRVDQPRKWEQLQMLLEDSDFDHETGDAHIEVKIVPLATAHKEGSGAIRLVQSDSMVQRSKGTNAEDNPDEYDFICDCSQLGPGWWVGTSPVKITVNPEISWDEFCELMTTKFGAPVLISYISTKGKTVHIQTEEDFNAACDQIEDEWDESGGDGSIQCVLRPPKGGMPVVKGVGEQLLLLPVLGERQKLQKLVNKAAARFRQRIGDVCAAIRFKEKAAGRASSSGEGLEKMLGITSEQALKAVYACKVLEHKDGEVLQAMERLILDDDMLLGIDASQDNADTKQGTKQVALSDRLVDWMSFVERFRLATPHEELVLRELHDHDLRVAMKGVYLQRQVLRDACSVSGGSAEWAKCDKLLREQCYLSPEQSERLIAWAKARQDSRSDECPPVADATALAEEAQVVDVGALMGAGLVEEAVLRVLKRRAKVEAALATIPVLAAQSGADEKRKAVDLCAAVTALSNAAGLSLAVARRLLLQSASVICRIEETQGVEGTSTGKGDGCTEALVDDVVVDGWLAKLWILHQGEIDTLERARDARRQALRRALVCQKESLVKAIRECLSAGSGEEVVAPQGKSADAGAQNMGSNKRGMAGVVDALVAACQREGVVCSPREAQSICDEVPVVAGSRDVAAYVNGLQLVDVVSGDLDECSQDLCGRISPFLEACDKLDSTNTRTNTYSLLLPPQILQALLSVGVPISIADAVVQACAHHAHEPVDYRDIVSGRLLVLAASERQRLSTPMERHQHKTSAARVRLCENAPRVLATLSQLDSLGRNFVEASQVLEVLKDKLQLPAEDCQDLIDSACGPPRGAANADGTAAAAARKIDYSLLGAFRVMTARPAVAAFCGTACAGCASVAETFLSRQGSVMQALYNAAATWRKGLTAGSREAKWGSGVMPYSKFEAVLRAELCGEAVPGGEWQMRHVRSLASAQGRIVVQVPGLDSQDRRDKADEQRKGPSYACHLVRVEGLSERFAVLEAADAAALRRLASLPHQHALGQAHAALEQHKQTQQDSTREPSWDVLGRATSPALLLLALPAPSLQDNEEDPREAQGLVCGDLQALTSVWGGGMSLQALIESLVPVYCHMMPVPAMALTSVATGKKGVRDRAKAAAAGPRAGIGSERSGGAGGLTRGQQVFRKLLASRKPSVLQILSFMGAKNATCVPSALNDATKKSVLEPAQHLLASIDPKALRCLQLSFVEAVNVPGPGEQYVAKNRMLKVSLFDAYVMKFVGVPLSVELSVPKDDKQESSLSWMPGKTVPKIFVSADLKTHAKMFLYFELGQLTQRKSDTAGKELVELSCGFAFMKLEDFPTGSSGKKELAVSGGTPFASKDITKEMLAGSKSGGGFLARLKGATSKSILTIKLDKVDKHILDMVHSKHLAPNTLCISEAALPIAHFQTISAVSRARARSQSPQKGRMGAAAANESSVPVVPVLEDLFTKAQVQHDPVLALFPKIRDSPQILGHFIAAWSHRYSKLSSKDKSKSEVLQNLVRECTLIVWPLMKMRALREESVKDAEAREKAAADYIKTANKARSLAEMHTAIAGSASAHQPFKIEELLE